jgi:hypothetical protein
VVVSFNVQFIAKAGVKKAVVKGVVKIFARRDLAKEVIVKVGVRHQSARVRDVKAAKPIVRRIVQWVVRVASAWKVA